MADQKQKSTSLPLSRQILIVAGSVLALFVLAFCIYSADSIWKNVKYMNNTNGSAQTVTVEGLAVCLPHKDTTGPQTMECAVGLKANNGKHYGVKNKDITGSVGTDKTIKVTGALEAAGDSKYDIVGTINAE